MDKIKVKILPSLYYMLHIDKYQINHLSHALLQIFLYEKLDNQVICFTETDEEISVIVSETMLEKLPSNLIQVSNASFKVFRAYDFEDKPGLISRFTQPLAKNEISIAVISTFFDLYLLIDKQKEKRAITSLNETNHFILEEISEQTDIPSNKKSSLGNSQGQKIITKLMKLPFNIQLVSLRYDSLKEIAYTLIQLLFFPENPERFFALVLTPTEMCMFLEKQDLRMLSSNHPKVFGKQHQGLVEWIPLQICEGNEGYSQHGILDRMLGPLAKEGIPIENLSTFNTNFVFVKAAQLEKARECLKQFEIEDN